VRKCETWVTTTVRPFHRLATTSADYSKIWDTTHRKRFLKPSRNRGVEYSIVQSVERGKWMWSLSLDMNIKKSGQVGSKPKGVIVAERAIDRAIDFKKRRLVPPRS
jgi:hypothetical protein